MKKNSSKLLITVAIAIVLSSCSQELYVSHGANDNKPLLFNNEYSTKELKPISVKGTAFWGIPGVLNNKNNHKNGIILSFNGVNIGKTSRILPIISMIGYSFVCEMGINKLTGIAGIEHINKKESNENYTVKDPGMGFFPSLLIGIPIAGALNNLTWNNAAFSGASTTLNYKLVKENPDVDIFFYPKYEIKKSSNFWFQEASVSAKVSGATLIKK